jgi:DNA invertase Pin-like site-specific DNA recombinase
VLGQAVFTIVAAIAQLERSLIAERVRTGLRRARAEGKRLGRPPVQVDPARVASTLRRKLSVREAARELGVSPSSYARLIRGLGNGDATMPAPIPAVAGL